MIHTGFMVRCPETSASVLLLSRYLCISDASGLDELLLHLALEEQGNVSLERLLYVYKCVHTEIFFARAIFGLKC